MRAIRGRLRPLPVVVIVLATMMAGCTFLDGGVDGWSVDIFRSSSQEEGRLRITEAFEVDYNVTWHEPFNEAHGGYEGLLAGAKPFRVVLTSPQPFEADIAVSGAVEEVEAEPPFLPSLRAACLKETNDTSREEGAVSIRVVRTAGRCTFHVNLTGDVSDPGGREITWGVENTAEMLERVRFIVAFEDATET